METATTNAAVKRTSPQPNVFQISNKRSFPASVTALICQMTRNVIIETKPRISRAILTFVFVPLINEKTISTMW